MSRAKNMCRCGREATLDVSIQATPPMSLEPPKAGEPHFRPLVHVGTVACRACAFAASELLLKFLESEGAPS